MVSFKHDRKTLTKQVLIGLSASCWLAFLAAHHPVAAETVEPSVQVEQVVPIAEQISENKTTAPSTESTTEPVAGTTEQKDDVGQTPSDTTQTPVDGTTTDPTVATPAETTTPSEATTPAPATDSVTPTDASNTPQTPAPDQSAETANTLAPTATPTDTSTKPAIELAPSTVYMTEQATIEEVVTTTTVNPADLTWTLNGKPLSEWKVWSQDTGEFSGAAFVNVVTTDEGNGKYTVKLQFNSLFGEDLSLRTPHNIRRTYRDYIGEYQLKGQSTDGKVAISKAITLRPYASFRTHDEMVAEVEETKNQAAQDRYVTIETIGQSAQGRPIKMAIIAKDQASIDQYLNVTTPIMLSTPDQVLTALKEGKLDYKLPVFLNNTHADEQPGIDIITSAFKEFATKDTISFDTVDENKQPRKVEYKVSDILDRLILLFNFTESPDSDALNMRYLPNGTDPNRDASYQVNPETRAVIAQLNKWNPISVLDLHGFVNPFMIEPATPPHDPNFEYDLLSKTMLEHAHEMGRAGITNSKYDIYHIPKIDYGQGWDDSFSGYTGVYALYHGIMGHTLEIPQSNEESFKAGFYAVLASLDYTKNTANKLMENRLTFYSRGVNKIESPDAEKELVNPDGSVKGREKGKNPKFFPDYYVIPLSNSKEYDVNQAFAMIEYFKRNGVIVQELKEDTQGYKKGDLVINMAQAKRGYANHILYSGSNESHWSEMYADLVVNFPALRGFVANPVFAEGLFNNKLGDVTTKQAPRTVVDEKADYYIVANNSINAVKAVNEAIAAGEKVYLYEDGYVFTKEAFKKAQEKYALYGEKGQQGLIPVGQELKALKIYVPYDYAGWVGYNYISDARRAMGELGFTVVEKIEDADVVILDSDRFDASVLGKKPTIVIGGEAMRQLERLNVLKGFDAERTGSTHEGLLKILLNDQDKLTSGYKANDLFYTNSGSWIQALPEGFREVAKVAASDYYIAGWWPENDKVAGKVVAIDGTYEGQPLFVYAGNPMNRSHTHNFYRWISNAVYRTNYAVFKKDENSGHFLNGEHGVTVFGKVGHFNGATQVVVTPVRIPVLEGKKYDGYDIKLVNEIGEVVQITGPVTVAIALGEAKDVNAVESVLYVLGDATERLPFESISNSILFDVSHFSTYALVYKQDAVADADDDDDKGTDNRQTKTTVAQTDHTNNATNKGAVLPNTGTQDLPTMVIGTVFVAIGGGILCLKRKEKTAE